MINVNLLPEEYKKEYKLEKARRLAVFIFLSLYITVIIFFGLMIGTYFFINSESKVWAAKIEEEKSTEKVKQVLSLEQDIKTANNKIDIISNSLKNGSNVAGILKSISSVSDNRSYFENLSLNFITKKASISGYSLTRDAVLEMSDKLQQNEFIDPQGFQNPKTNILKKDDIDFSFLFNIKSNESDSKK